MKRIQPTPGKVAWPRWAAPKVECRKRDLVVRIADWTRQHDAPAYDVEVYIGGVYDWNESQTFCITPETTKAAAKAAAVAFAQAQIAKLL